MQVAAIFRGVSQAAMKYRPPDVAALRRSWNPETYSGWRRAIDHFRVVQGVRPVLEHVEEARWVAHFAANEDPVSAVVAELTHVAE
jgi:hypothetical protein